MNYITKGLSPEKVLQYFETISNIPRGSGNEAGIASYLMEFAAERGLEARRDEANNVLIRKPGVGCSPDAPYVMLQGHTDMVCEKNSGTVHDFEHDGIKLILDGDTLSADGTTLGGDDGVAVAIMLALLDGDSSTTPPLECLFTTSEEVGLDGMHAFDFSDVKSRMLINIDSESEGIVTVACAGGVRTDIVLPLDLTDHESPSCKVSVSGLAGGHSGEDINKHRGNANKLAARLALAGAESGSFKLAEITGGSKDNAIPRECGFVFTSDDIEKTKKAIYAEAEIISAELAPCDKGFAVSFTDCPPNHFATESSTRAAISLLNSLPYGVISISRAVSGLVETSSNVGVVRTEGGKLKITCSSRSSVDTKLTYVMKTLESVAYLAGASASHRARYPGWDATEGSKLQDTYARVYKAETGKAATMIGIHAGLECGIVKGKVPDMDIISIGPELHAIHSPDESMSISSLDRTYELIKKILRTIALNG